MKALKIFLSVFLTLFRVFIVTFVATFTGSSVTNALDHYSFDISYGYLARNSTVYGLCTVFVVAIVLPGMYIVKKYVWPVLKFLGLKIRYFFHGY